MQRVYQIKPDVLRYQWLVLPGDGHLDGQVFAQFCGQPWSAPPAVDRLVRAPDEANLPIGDFPNLDPSVLVISDRALRAMPALWAESGQLWRVEFEDQSLYLFNTYTVPSLTESNIRKQLVGGGGLSALFRPNDKPNGRPYVTDRFVDLYLKNDLRGLLFNEHQLTMTS